MRISEIGIADATLAKLTGKDPLGADMSGKFKDSLIFKVHDDTPYDDEIPTEFRASEPPPPPFDVGDAGRSPHDDAMDLIAWALDQLE